MVAIKSALTFLVLGAHVAQAVSNVICSSELGTKSIQSNKIPRATTTVSERITIVKKFIRKVNVVVVGRPYTTTEITTIQTTVISTADPNVKTATSHVTGTHSRFHTWHAQQLTSHRNTNRDRGSIAHGIFNTDNQHHDYKVQHTNNPSPSRFYKDSRIS